MLMTLLLFVQAPFQILAPDHATAGSPLAISWQGPAQDSDYLTVVSPEAQPNEYGPYVYTREGHNISLPMPTEPGRYEIRLNRESNGTVLARHTLVVTAPKIEISAPKEVKAGATVEIRFKGPLNEKDWITFAPAGSEASTYLDYAYCEGKESVSIQAPAEPGSYEVRYMAGTANTALAAIPIRVNSVNVSLAAPAKGQIGAKIEVSWQGPGHERDYLTVVPADAPEGNYDAYWYVAREPNPVIIALPSTPGQFEIRYQVEPSNQVLARQPIEIVDAKASLKIQGSVRSGEPFLVNWEGPNGEGDFVSILKENKDSWWNWAYTKWGNPVALQAPDLPGTYQVCYQVSSNRILAEAKLEVLPGEQPGSLVVQETKFDPGKGLAVEVILDASGSMLKKDGAQTRMETAIEAISALIQNELPAECSFALRVFGHLKADSCDTQLEIPLRPLDRNLVLAKIKSIQAKNLARTPIAASLDQVDQDLAGASANKLVILLTDGEETCGGDPAQSIKALQAKGTSVRVNIVGFAVADLGLKRQFSTWAQTGNGVFLDASESRQLKGRLAQSLKTPFRVVDSAGQVKLEATADGETRALSPGAYRLQWGTGWKLEKAFEVRAQQQVALTIP